MGINGLLPLMAMSGDEMAQIAACIGVFGIPIIAILTAHQRKMAMIIHNTQQMRRPVQDEAIASEVRDLKQLVYQQAIAIDAINTKLDRMAQQPASVESRLTGTQG